jgi:hypothetical protein
MTSQHAQVTLCHPPPMVGLRDEYGKAVATTTLDLDL